MTHVTSPQLKDWGLSCILVPTASEKKRGTEMGKKYYVAVRLLDYLGRVVTGPGPLDVYGDEIGRNDVYYYDSPFEAYAAAKFFKPARDNGIYMYRCVYNVVTVEVEREPQEGELWDVVFEDVLTKRCVVRNGYFVNVRDTDITYPFSHPFITSKEFVA